VKKVVGRGETLRGLAQRYGVRVARLRQANCLPNNLVKWGQILYVPGRG
jgi:LysM repeat protein